MHGFILEREERIAELSSTVKVWRHEGSGAVLLSFCNEDENKVFGVSFRTPPPDSSGVAHILEHSVLCGSERFPVKEPFVELLKGSLQTFLNAFTYPDKTCYPVASANLKDFYNLTEVYLDAVFFPRITEDIFRQEGWHLEPEENEGRYIYKGVVYNEMKGAFSSPESVLERFCLHAVFPDTVYALESGGDPMEIPSLTYEAFLDFHRRYYHPSNGRFFWWGDDPEEERLARLDAVLRRFSPLRVDSSIALQKSFTQPVTVTVPFAASEDGEDKGMAVVNWLGPDVMDVELGLAFRMLEYMLLGMPASPLRRALIESGLGEDLAGHGLEAELRQLTFNVGLKGLAVEDAAAMLGLIQDTLAGLVREGLPDDLMEAAVNSVEFAMRENNSGRFPVGLSVMLRSLTTWLHDGDPLTPLRFEEPLGAIKAHVRAKDGYFEGLLTRWFVDNPHRVMVVLTPDAALAARQEEEEARRLEAVADAMNEREREEVGMQAELLRRWQSTPDTPEALAAIPRVEIADLPLKNSVIPTLESRAGGQPALFHGLPTGGIVYAEAGLDLSGVPRELLPLLSLYARALLEMGTRKRDFVQLNMAVAGKTGGMDADPLFLSHADTRASVARMVLSGKATPDRLDDLFELMAEVLTEAVFTDKERFARMVLEEKARLEHGLVPSGHMVVAARLRASLSHAGWLTEQTSGISYLGFVRQLTRRVEKDWEGVRADLRTLHERICLRGGLEINLTALPEQEGRVLALAEGLAAALPQGHPGREVWTMETYPPEEALLLPAQVNYTGKGINLFEAGYQWHGSAAVILKFLRTGYLWDRVRVQGGAYGCMCGLDRMNGSFFMVSYRDPNIQPTLDVYDGAAAYLQAHTLGREELNAAIVGAIGELDTYLLPDAKGSTAYARLLNGDTEERRARLREEILATQPGHFKDFGQALEAFSAKGRICALGGSALERAANESGWLITRVL